MSFETAVGLSEIFLALSLLQQSSEHLMAAWDERRLFIPRMVLALLLLAGVQPPIVEFLLLLLGLAILDRFQGPYNGGSDRLSLLMLCCLFLTRIIPVRQWQEAALGYLAVQVILSYAISGWMKLRNPDWRNGRALADIFQLSVYPVSASMRTWAPSSLLTAMSWGAMLFEILFPLALIDAQLLQFALSAAATFHLANACCFGLNRFLWIWLAAYPSVLWLQDRIVESL